MILLAPFHIIIVIFYLLCTVQAVSKRLVVVKSQKYVYTLHGEWKSF